jgi:MFS superfamily sulfate permease-like transporter
VNTSAVIISCVSIPFLYGSKLLQIKYKDRLKGFPIPAELFLIIVTTTVCYFLPEPNKVIIVGEVPGGLPKPFLPPFLTMFSDIFADALVISIVSYGLKLIFFGNITKVLKCF